MADWTRTLTTTIRKYMKGFEQEVLRNRVLTALMLKKGRVIFNESGDGKQWQLQYRYAPMTGNLGNQPVSFAQQDYLKTPYLDWRGYVATDAISKRELLKNRGAEALVKTMDTMIPRLSQGIEEQFAEELYVDGNATGNENRIHGIESFMGVSSNATINSAATAPSFASRSADASDFVAAPSDTYAGYDTALGTYGGSQRSGIWPSGTTDPEADFFTPILVNYTSTGLGGGGADGWDEATDPSAVKALRYGIIKSRRNKSKRGMLDMVILDGELYRGFLKVLDSKERINTTSTLGLRALGFEEVVQLDGVDITWEYGVPSGQNATGFTLKNAATGYGFNVDFMELFSAQDVLFKADDVDYDITNRTYRVAVDFLGNLKCESPRHFCKWMGYI